MNGSVNLDNIRNGHVEVDSLSGDVTMKGVNGPLVQVVSTSGRINYIGDFGSSGEYRLTSHSGDIEATIPDWTSADVSARSVRGKCTTISRCSLKTTSRSRSTRDVPSQVPWAKWQCPPP